MEMAKENILNHFISSFIMRKSTLPKIIIQEHYAGNPMGNPFIIESSDIPDVEKTDNFEVCYRYLDEKGKARIIENRSENFTISSFRLTESQQKSNAVQLISNGQVISGAKIRLECIRSTDTIDGNRYVFLISSPFLDEKDGDSRGEFKILSVDEYRDAGNDGLNALDPDIVIDDISEKANVKIVEMHSEFKDIEIKKNDSLQKLREMFFLSPAAIEEISVATGDSDETILGKLYKAEAKTIAKYDAEIKEKFDALELLDVNSAEFDSEFDSVIHELAEAIPAQNRHSISKYLARRNMVLTLCSKILDKKLAVQAGSRNVDEKLLHNLIFRQKSIDTESSNLWLLSDDYIYFSGNSEHAISQLEIDGEKIIKSSLSEEEMKYVLAAQENKLLKRPDILLYPQEGKCIIIELKNPDVNVATQLGQLSLYAGILRNLTISKYEFTSFYGYLIGENVDLEEVRTYDADFKASSQFNFVFRPLKTILGRFGRKDGEMYMEVIQYSEILKRAQLRNKIFAKKLGFDVH